jgi:ubiquinone biosynthesis protein
MSDRYAATTMARHASRRRRRHTHRRHDAPGRRSFWHQLDSVLTAVERAARELRSLAEASASAIELAAEHTHTARTLTTRAKRLHDTGSMLARLVLGYRLFGLRTAFSSREQAELLREQLHTDNASRFLHTSREQGGAFLKVGQLLSARADLLPEVWVRELSSLQDSAPPIAGELTQQALHEAFGDDLPFAELDELPLAAASIGQVHRARTLGGLEVAVKVQRPGIAALVEDDLALLGLCFDALRSSLPPVALDTIVEQIRAHVLAEVDYVREAELGLRVARFFKDAEHVIVPAPISALCCPTVLTTELVAARKITDVLDELSAQRAAGDTAAHTRISELLGLLLEAYLRQILQLGTFQADPHPGNLMVTPTDQLVILDFGCAGELSTSTRAAYLQLLEAFFQSDDTGMLEAFAALGFKTESGRADTLLAFMQALLGELAEAVQHGEVSWPDRESLSARASGLGRTLLDDPVVEIPDHFVMIGRVLTTLGGLFSHYRPNLDVVRHVLPVLTDAKATH